MINILKHIDKKVLAMPRVLKRAIVLVVDASLCIFCVWFAVYLRIGEFVYLSGNLLFAAIASIIIALPIFIVSGLYRAVFRYSGWPALMTVAKAVGLYGIFYSSIFTAIGFIDVPRTVGIIQPVLLLFSIGASRAFARYWLGGQYQVQLKRAQLPKALIYGAGKAGQQLASAMRHNHEIYVVGFLDDDIRLRDHIINGLTVYDPSDLSFLVEYLNINSVLLAMPSINRKRRGEIIAKISSAKVAARTLPSVNELAQGKVTLSDLKELDIDDLLGREPVIPQIDLLEKNIKEKIVLVTGSGGSIGSELCRQIIVYKPKRLLLLDQNEFSLYEIHHELEQIIVSKNIILTPILGSILDEVLIAKILKETCPDIIYHAAAYKHVPLVEMNPAVGIRNNVFGTFALARLALEFHVPNFVLISTDKAVRPTNVMGASKRLAEMILQALAKNSESTNFSMVRFGNVLGSSGSVVPRFRQQIRDGGPITVTHKDVTRFFMTIPEAAQLVVQASAMAESGDLFILDMGEPVKIYDFARRMIELSGLTVKDVEMPDGDIEIKFIGLRPGEKLYEELLIDEGAMMTSHPRILKAREGFLAWSELEKELSVLEDAIEMNDIISIREALRRLVSGYQPDSRNLDWLSSVPLGDNIVSQEMLALN